MFKTFGSFLFKKKIKNDLILRKILSGEIKKKLSGFPNIDKPWLKYYTEEQIKRGPINKTCYRYLYEENYKCLNSLAIIFMGRKIKFFELFNEIDKVSRSLKQKEKFLNEGFMDYLSKPIDKRELKRILERV